jgi:endogenous inhibitor of DNA gyrase (YacG/DUF329 family)
MTSHPDPRRDTDHQTTGSTHPAERLSSDQDTSIPGVAHALEAIDTGSVLRETPTDLVCPGCTEVVESYPGGLPAYVSYCNHRCQRCELELKRWAIIAVDGAYINRLDPEIAATLVQAYWEQNLWEGIQTSGEYPRTEEYTEAYQRMAQRFSWSWELTCPLCRRPLSEIAQDRLEYHHWRRGADDQGICLCRDCHGAISNQAYDNEVDWRARELGLRGKDDLQIARLAQQELTHGESTDHATLAKILVDRYNLPYTIEVVQCILRQVLTVEALTDAIDVPTHRVS